MLNNIWKNIACAGSRLRSSRFHSSRVPGSKPYALSPSLYVTREIRKGSGEFRLCYLTLRVFDFEHPQGVHFRRPSGWSAIVLKYLTLDKISAVPIPMYSADRYCFGIAECRSMTPIVTMMATVK